MQEYKELVQAALHDFRGIREAGQGASSVSGRTYDDSSNYSIFFPVSSDSAQLERTKNGTSLSQPQFGQRPRPHQPSSGDHRGGLRVAC